MSEQPTTPKSESTVLPISFIQKYALAYYIPTLLYIVIWTIHKSTNQPSYSLLFVFLLPFIGRFFPKDNINTKHAFELNRSVLQVIPLIVHCIATWIFLIAFFIDYPVRNYNTNQSLQLLVVMVFSLTMAFTTTHELLHKDSRILNYFGYLNLVIFQFTVYPIQHVYLHHKMVGTKEDPITCPKNRNLYFFTLNAFVSAHKFACRYDFKKFVVCMVANWIYIGALVYFAMREYQDWNLALWKVGFFLGVGLSGYLMFQAGEYVEHYGLIYRDKDGEITQKCSFNTQTNYISNYLLFRVVRHSDHHLNAYKMYSALDMTDTMPIFPFGMYEAAYFTFIPPLWNYVMNPYVDKAVEGKEVSKTHEKIVQWIAEFMSWGIMLYVMSEAYQVYAIGKIAIN